MTQSSGGKSLTRVAEFGYDPATGILNKEVVEPTTFPLTTNYGLDSFGNVNTETVSGSDIVTRFTKTDYNTPYGRFPETVTNEMGHVETRLYDSTHGGILRLTGPNQLTTRWTYDALGRVASEQRADGTATNISYAWCTDCPSATAVYRIKTTSTGAPDVIEYFDSLNRQVLTQTQSFSGNGFSNVQTQYDALGRVFRVSRPYLSGDPVYLTEYGYDELGRAIRENSPVTGLNEIDYTRLTATSTRTVVRADGSTPEITKETKDARGLTIETVDANSNSTFYTYDPFGNLETVRDSTGNTTTNIYDVRGFKKDTFDPDMGHWHYEYDVLGELKLQTDAKGQGSTFDYDKLGRMVKRFEPESGTRRVSTWVYDTAVRGVGQLGREVSALETNLATPDFTRAYAYDNLSRPTGTTTTIDGINYTSSQTYDLASRVSVLTYPTNFAVRNAYTASGYLEHVEGGQRWSNDAPSLHPGGQ